MNTLDSLSANDTLELLLQVSPAAIAVFDTDMRYIAATQSWSELYEITHLDLVGKSHYEVFPDLPEHLHSAHDRALMGETLEGTAERIDRPDGSVVFVDWTLRPWLDHSGGIKGALMITEDVSTRVALTESLKASEETLAERNSEAINHDRLLARMERVAEIGTWQLDIDSSQITWSDQTRKIHETEPDFQPVLETGISFYEPGESQEKITRAVQRCIEKGIGWDLELTLITAKGRRIWVRTQGEGEFENGRCVRLFGVFQDITSRHQLLESLSFEKERLELVLEGSGLGLWDWNPETDRITYDERWCKILGHTTDEIESNYSSWYTRIHADDIPAVQTAIKNHLDGNTQFFDAVYRMRHRMGIWIYVHTRGKVVARDNTHQAIRFTGTIEDVTAREHAALQRQQLYAMTAHELRTPLSALDMMCSSDSREEWWAHRTLFQSTLKQTFHTLDDMRMLINPDLKRPTRKENVQVKEFNQTIVSLTTAVVITNSFKLDLIEKLPQHLAETWFETDTYRLRAALLNVIRNACIHSKGDHIWLTSSIADNAGGEKELCWTVEDNGTGVDEQIIDRLFEPFARGTTGADGTGMGLHIAQQWLREIGGDVTYEAIDSGSRFYIRIPAVHAQRRLDNDTNTARPNHSGRPLRVLFVEDDRTLGMLGRKILKDLGMKVELAKDGKQACDMLAAGFDIIMTDYYMPNMTGKELAIQARDSGFNGPIIVLTAANLADEEAVLLDAGADEVLVKPLTPSMMTTLCDRLKGQGKLPANTWA